MEIKELVDSQKVYFQSFETFDYAFRIKQLKLLKRSIQEHQQALINAFHADLNKCEFDAVTTEISLVYNEINFMLKHLRGFMRPKKVATGLLNFPSYGKIIKEPLGQVLIMSPWNYPFQLTICPLVGAIAGGNTAVVKPSAYTPKVSQVIDDILSVFPDNYIATVLGGREQNQTLLDQEFDLIFFTGSKTVGRIVQEKGAVHLTPVVLELGGKSPCIISETAVLESAVKRVVWGKFLNAGQTCIAPDYIFVHESIYDEFLKLATQYVKQFYYEGDNLSNNFMYIVNERHVDRLKDLIQEEKVVTGGKITDRLIEPTIMKDVTFDDPVMEDEIFGPIMPVLKYNDIKEVITYVNSNDKPLALYYFGQNKEEIDNVFNHIPSGGACLNDVVMHFTEKNLPFGGVGESGMGCYHGKKSFETFTHAKSILCKAKSKEINVKYPPYTEKKTNFVYKFLHYKK